MDPPTRRWGRCPQARGVRGRSGTLSGCPRRPNALSTFLKSILSRPPQQSGPARELLIGSAPGPPDPLNQGNTTGRTIQGPRCRHWPPGPAPLRPGSTACRDAFPVTPTSPSLLGNVVLHPRDATLSWSSRASLLRNRELQVPESYAAATAGSEEGSLQCPLGFRLLLVSLVPCS